VALRTRQPTGRVAYPLILVEGAEKVGKSYTSFALSASEKVGRTFVFDLGEGTADEYARLGPYEVVDHDGTFTDLLGQMREATAVPMDDGHPNVIVLDSATVLWESIKDWAGARARNGNKAKKLLRQDPDAEVSIPMNIWTDAADRWGQVMHLLRYWDGIGVLICRGKEVAKVGSDGQPVMGQTDYKIEAHKATQANVTAHIRCMSPGAAVLVDARSLDVSIPSGGLRLPAENPLEHVVFDILGAGGAFQTSSAVEPQPHDPAPAALIGADDVARLTGAMKGAADPSEAKAMWHARFGVWPSRLPVDRLAEADDFISDLTPAPQEPPA